MVKDMVMMMANVTKIERYKISLDDLKQAFNIKGVVTRFSICAKQDIENRYLKIETEKIE